MSRDIRSFFSVGGASKPSTTQTLQSQKRKPIVLDDSDSDNDTKAKRIVEVQKSANKESANHKKRRVLYSSDEDEQKISPKKVNTLSSKLAALSTKGADSKKMKMVNVANVFGDKPVKRVEKEKKAKKPSEKEIFENSTDDIELASIDLSLSPSIVEPSRNQDSKKTPKKDDNTTETNLSPKMEPHVLKSKNKMKSPKTEKKTPVKFTPIKQSPPDQSIDKVSDHKRSESDSNKPHCELKFESTDDDYSGKEKKQTPTTNKKATKRPKDDDGDLDLSVYDPDQERHEKRRAAAILYQKFQKRAGPPNPGSKEIPKGKPNCFAGLAFVLTGVFDSMERDEAASVIKELGGRVTSALSGKTNYVVAGEDSGPAKLAKAEDLGIPILSEDDLLNLIREKSDLPIAKKANEAKGKVISPPNESVRKPQIEEKREIKKEKHSGSPLKHESPKMLKPKDEPIKTNEIKIKLESVKEEKRDLAQAWVDKYKPQTIKDIIGQQGPASNCAKLVKWLTNWHKNNNGKTKPQRPNPWAKNDDGSFFKAALLSGPPGVGKTTTAQLACQHLGFDTIEFNASDTRSKKLLQVEVAELLSNKTLHGYFNGRNKSLTEKQVLLMDEVDGMAGNEDRGGMQELIALIKSSSVPIICMCNDRNHPKIRSLVNYCFDLRFARPQVAQIKGAILSICFKEGVKIPPKTIEEIIQATNNDIRQTLNSISLLSAKPDIADSKVRTDNGKKDLKLGPWEVVRKVFSAEEHKSMTLNDKSDLFFHDYSLGPLFVQQNYLSVSPNVPKPKVMEQVALTADSLSLGDLVENRIRSRMAWSMLPVQAMYSSVLPGEYMAGHLTGQINFPGWLGKYSKTQKRSRLAQEIHDHTRIRTSGSRLSVRLDYAPFLLKNIVQPMIDDKADGIEEALNVIKEYRLLREDIDALVELTSWPGKKSPMDAVDGRVKAALTRAYNKEVNPYSYSAITNVKKKKTVAIDADDYAAELGGKDGVDEANASDDNDEDDDNLDNDALIKAKKSTKTAGTQNSKAGGTNKASSSSSGRGSSSSAKRAGSSKKK